MTAYGHILPLLLKIDHIYSKCIDALKTTLSTLLKFFTLAFLVAGPKGRPGD